MYDRIIKLIGDNNFNKINTKKILLVGVGGVGGFVFETLIRSGFNNITIIDYDIVEESNINRQLVANLNTIGLKKVNVLHDYAKLINKDLNIIAIDKKLTSDNINILDTDYDYIIDACDSIDAKLELVKYAINNNIKIICSMGMGNRIDATCVKISTLDKTINDPLARNFRKLIKDNKIQLNIPVVYSDELPIKNSGVNSIITPPSVAGIYLVNYIINDIIKLY